jgi:DNA-binding SARP family transcriptional activator/ATP/maltotriose-dependent transcriptional regulator MalT
VGRPTTRFERPDLERRLDAALTHRLTTLTAAAGHGKSVLLDRWGAAVGAVQHRLGVDDRELPRLGRHVIGALRLRVPELPRELSTVLAAPLGPAAGSDASARAAGLAGALSEALHGALRRDLVLVLDDLQELEPGTASAQFLDALLRGAPNRLHVVTASRTAPPFAIDRLRVQEQVLELTAADLTLDLGEVTRWVVAAGGDEAAAHRILAHTAGWPVAVAALTADLSRLTAEDLAGRDGSPAVLPQFDDLVLAAFEALPAPARRLTLLAVLLPHVTPSLAEALGLPSHQLREIHRAGLLLDLIPDEAEAFRATPAARSALRHLAEADPDAASSTAAAARWFVVSGQPELGLRVLLDRGDVAGTEALLADHGDELATGPGAATVLAVIDATPGFASTTAGLRLGGLAHHALGGWDRAQELLGAIAADGDLDATAAWRLGLVHHLRGELDEAAAVYERGRTAEPASDAVICTAMLATVHWLRGDRDRCADAADDALTRAQELGEDRPLAATHTVLAMLAALDGDRRANDAHYLRAAEHAERAGDTFQLIRIHTNRASHHLEEGAYTDALAELEIAGRLAELTGFSPFAAVALSNRAEALVHLGRLEEAAADAADAVATWRQLGSRLVVYGLEQVAAVQRLRGDRAGAAASYADAIAEAEAAEDVQGLVSARAGYAELLCDEDPDAAVEVARRAVEHGPGMGYVAACLAMAQACHASGDRIGARQHLERARAEALIRRDTPALAAALELRARLDGDETLAEEAVAAWAGLGDPIALARAELTRAEIAIADPDRRTSVAEAVQQVAARLHDAGCHAYDDRIATLLPALGDTEAHAVTVQTLGGFRVWRDGRPLSRTDWQSRKARLLVKLLASCRGEATSRDWLAGQLWPDTDVDTAEKRLRVLVSTVRGTLDPQRRGPSDHLIVSDHDTLRLDLGHVDLDLVRFLDEVETAARLDAQGRDAEALARWRAAEAAYTGPFCPEERYADWSVRIREELRSAYVQACARVATAEAAAGHHDEAVRRWLRLLEVDPYDERAHIGLVRALLAAGRRPEARRRYRTYAERVHELGLEAVPFPAT